MKYGGLGYGMLVYCKLGNAAKTRKLHKEGILCTIIFRPAQEAKVIDDGTAMPEGFAC
jgi:hypothetical protein